MRTSLRENHPYILLQTQVLYLIISTGQFHSRIWTPLAVMTYSISSTRR